MVVTKCGVFNSFLMGKVQDWCLQELTQRRGHAHPSIPSDEEEEGGGRGAPIQLEVINISLRGWWWKNINLIRAYLIKLCHFGGGSTGGEGTIGREEEE